MFVDRSEPGLAEQAVLAGVSAYVVDGLSAARVRSVLEVAMSRFQLMNGLRQDLEKAKADLASRKTIERAKALLMKERGLDEGRRLSTSAEAVDGHRPSARRGGRRPAGVCGHIERRRLMIGDRPLRLGFIALNDAAILIVAKERGLFAAEGLEVELSREVSWATIRDKVNVGALDGAHMLGPMALATSVGAAGAEATPLVGAMALNLNGPAVTLSSRLAKAVGADKDDGGLARLVARRREEGASPITLAVVFPFSSQNYLLRDWLAAAGIDPDRDVRLVVAPPSRMTELLVEGVVEGFCVTEPWDSAAVAAGAGRIAVRASEFWPRAPDKVFAVTEAWAAANRDVLQALLRAMVRAAAWVDDPANRRELAGIMARPHYVGAAAEVIEASLGDMVFLADGATTPAPVHAAWLLSQMMRWGHVQPEVDILSVARRVYRSDLHAEAAAAVGLAPADAPTTLPGFGGGFELAGAQAYALAARRRRVADV